MANEVLKLASTQGIWATLSVVLIFYILKTQEKRDLKQDEREQKYQEIIATLTDKLNVIESVRKDVEEVKSYIITKQKES
ncbi:BhlA/UviB family holin-like peptide [Alkaliphilus oremlandii]|uniref:Phage related protein n=1 Tax=Alkaliphilus oremlandii (strain OhILAs) TaxID=350688 RepID=A8MFT3_ALKOO|nr:BhlA/UviB family holin-like peptide [Alkaliphilus oremlandii]ABW17722.1 phage related protein [Alkaliphilus oremlandii OhILAs]